jgi:uncharacterized protein YndB with AHSA1/START domain
VSGRTRTITYGTVLPVPPERAFAVVTDPARWPEFSAGTVSAETDPGWGRPGGRGRMVNRFLGATVRSELEVLEWEPGRAFRYRGTQPGRPATDNRRTFEALPGGTRLRASTTVVLRPGPLGLLDRLQVRVLQRVYDRAMARLPQVVASSS